MRLWGFIFAALALISLPFATAAETNPATQAASVVAALFLAMSAATFFYVAGRDFRAWTRRRR